MDVELGTLGFGFGGSLSGAWKASGSPKLGSDGLPRTGTWAAGGRVTVDTAHALAAYAMKQDGARHDFVVLTVQGQHEGTYAIGDFTTCGDLGACAA